MPRILIYLLLVSFFTACLIYVIAVALIVIAEPLIPIPCDNEESNQPTQLVFKNVLFHYTPCIAEHRYPHLLYLTRMECRKARHLLLAVFLGCMIGYERRQNDRPAGIRTMGLVSLGSCLFTINSTFAFLEGPMVRDISCQGSLLGSDWKKLKLSINNFVTYS